MRKSLVAGIEIGTHYIRAVVLYSQNGDVILKSYQEILTLETLFSVNNLFNYQEIVKKFQELKRVFPRSCKHVAISISDNAVFNHIIPLDIGVQEAEIPFAIEQALALESLIPVQDLSIDFTKVEMESSVKSSTRNFYVCTTHKELINEAIEIISKSGFNLALVEAESQSLARILYLIERHYPTEYQDGKNKNILLHFSDTATTVCCEEKNRIPYCKVLPLSLAMLNEGCVSSFIEQLSELICSELLVISPCFENISSVTFWLVGKLEKESTLNTALEQKLNVAVASVLGITITVNTSIFSVSELFSFEGNERALCGYEKAASLAFGALEWGEVL